MLVVDLLSVVGVGVSTYVRRMNKMRIDATEVGSWKTMAKLVLLLFCNVS